MKKRNLILCILAVCLVGALAWFNHAARSMQSDLTYTNENQLVCSQPVIDGMVKPFADVTFDINSESEVSTITPATIAKLRARGCRVDSSFYPMLWRDNTSTLRLSTKRYTVDFPVEGWAWADSTMTAVNHNGNVEMTFKNVDFVPSVGDLDILGLDFLDNFAMEYRVNEHEMTLFTEVPAGYVQAASLTQPFTIYSLLGCPGQYFVDVDFDGFSQDYIIDTSLSDVHVKMPMSDTIYIRGPFTDVIATSDNGVPYKAKNTKSGLSSIGNRVGNVSVNFYSDGSAQYAINPFRFTVQDIVIDFKENRFCYRPKQ